MVNSEFERQAIEEIKRRAQEKGILFDEADIICAEIDGKGVAFLTEFIDGPECFIKRRRFIHDEKYLFTWVISAPIPDKVDFDMLSATGSWEMPGCVIYCLDWSLFLIWENGQVTSAESRFPDPSNGSIIIPPYRVTIKQEVVGP